MMLVIIDKVLARLSRFSANVGAGTASIWNTYQPKEPENIRKRK